MGKPVIEEKLGVVPFIGAVQEDQLQFAPVAGGGSGVGMLRRLGPAGLGGAHARIDAQKVVMILQDLFARRRGEREAGGLADLAKFRDGHGGLKNFQQVARGGDLVWRGQAVGGLEEAIGASQFARALVHQSNKRWHGTAGESGQGHGRVVVRPDQKRLRQGAHGNGFADFQRDAAGLDHGVGFFHEDIAREVRALIHEQRGQQLGRAGGRIGGGGIFAEQDLAGGDIHEERAAGVNFLGEGRRSEHLGRFGESGQLQKQQKSDGYALPMSEGMAGDFWIQREVTRRGHNDADCI